MKKTLFAILAALVAGMLSGCAVYADPYYGPYERRDGEWRHDHDRDRHDWGRHEGERRDWRY